MNNTLNQTNDFLANNAWWIALSIAVVIILTVVLIFVFGKKSKKAPKEPKRVIDSNKYYEALGGKDNVISYQRTGSRISLKLNDFDAIDKEKIKEAGVDGFIKMSDKLILVIKGDAEAVEKTLFGSNEASE